MLTPQISSGTLLTSDNCRIHFDHYQAGHPKAVVIAHGFFNSKSACLLKELADEMSKEYDVVIFDFRGHGRSHGLFYWTSKEDKDLEAVLRFARGRYACHGVIGFSLGAATSITTAAEVGLMDSLIAVSPPAAFEKIEYRFWELDVENDIVYNLWGEGKTGKGVRPGPFWMAKTRPEDVIGRLKIPVLFIHGDKDWLITPKHSEILYGKAATKKKLFIIPNGPHAEYLIRKNKETTLRQIKGWFRETLKNTQGK